MRVEARTTGEKDATRLHNSLSTFLSLFRSVQESMETKGADPDVKKFFDSLDVEQEGHVVVLKADLQPGFVKKLVSAPPPVAAPPSTPSPAAESAKSPKPKP
jgi:hypothetical protein